MICGSAGTSFFLSDQFPIQFCQRTKWHCTFDLASNWNSRFGTIQSIFVTLLCVLSNFRMGNIFPWNFFVLKLFYELVRFMTENHHCLFPNNLGPNIVRKDSFSGHSSGNTFYHEKPGKALFFLYFPKTQNKIT